MGTAAEILKEQYNNTTPPVLSELLHSAAYYNIGAANPLTARSKPPAQRSTELQLKEMADTIKAERQDMQREKEELTETMKAMAEAMRAKDDALKEKDRDIAEA